MLEFTDNMLIICPSTFKMAILKKMQDEKRLLNIKFMSIEEYQKKIKFDYDEKAIHYLVKKRMKVDNAITFLNNLYYIDDKDYNNEKLDYLVRLKKELDDNNLLIYDALFSKMISRYNIVIYGYGKLDNWTLSLFHNAKIIDYPKINDKFKVYSHANITNEIECVFQRICDLLQNDIDINHISLMNIDSEYYPIIKRMSMFYNIPIELPCNETLMGTVLGKKLFDLVLENKNREDIFEELAKYKDSKNYSAIIEILNKYVDFDMQDIHEQIRYELENRKVKQESYDNVLKIKNVFDYVSDDEYIFLMNFNNASIPKLSLDIDYITDNIKNMVNLPLVEEVNALSKENTLNYLKSIQNLIISYKETSSFNKYYPSILLDDMDYELMEYKYRFNYSNDANKSLYTTYLDDLVKYGIKNENLEILEYNYQDNWYLSYNNAFSGIDKDELVKFLNNELILSYSSVDNYYKCGFKYYLANILKVNLYEETFMTIIGNLFHDVLRHMNDDDFDLNRQYENFLRDRTFTNKEKFFLAKLKSDLEYVIEVIKKHQFITGFNQMLYEQKIEIELKKSPYVHFKGFVDKIMYKEAQNETMVSIVDYKTYEPDIKIKNLEFGLSMQLPIYLYLVHHSNLFQNPKFAGFYLQHILNIDVKKDKKSVEEQKYNNLKLTGYSTNNLERLAAFDSTYENSEMIRGLKLTKDGLLSKNSKTLSDEEIDGILKMTEAKIINAMDEILAGKFDINPKIINGVNESCTFCPFSDICYHEEKNNVYLKREEDEDESNTGTEVSD